jgi:exodeoxyribonuclease VII large subunit
VTTRFSTYRILKAMEPPTEAIGVKAFLHVLNETLSFAFPSVIVEGEVSSFKVNQGKWVFFDLKDDDATLPCFMPVYQLKVPLEDGMKARVTGVPKVTNWGKFSFTAKSIELAGEGALKRAFELLRAKLEAEGLFDASRKRPLPRFPHTIGLVTSGASAAYADFIKIVNARWGGVRILLADVQVQGQPAPEQVAGAIGYLNQLPDPPDVIVIIRGGGSLEDLQAFNTELVARAIAASRTPTLVGVGHEVDTSLADLAADVRAATPTNAAQLVVPDRAQLLQEINHRNSSLEQGIRGVIGHSQHTIRHQLTVLERYVRLPATRLQTLEQRLLQAQSRTLELQQRNLTSLQRLLASYDPTATLKRGYAIVRAGERVVTDPAQVKTGDELMLQLAAGMITTTAKAKGASSNER